MAKVEKLAVFGKRPSCANRSRIDEKLARARAQAERARKMEKPGEFVAYESTEEDEQDNEIYINNFLKTSYNFADYLKSRELDLREKKSVSVEYPARQMISHELFKEHPLHLPNMNKILCSQWLSHRQIIFGTKCNQLMIYDVNTRKLDEIPLLRSETEPPPQPSRGIHAVRFNPSKTLMVTGSKNPNDLAIYRSPTMDPICTGKSVHKEWLFDFCWLDDEFFVSGSRDNHIGLWRANEDELAEMEGVNNPQLSPLTLKLCKQGHHIEAFAFNSTLREIAVLSLSGYIHIWKAELFKQTYSRKLPTSQENNCIAVKDGGLYGIGCRSYSLLLDPRTLHSVKRISAKFTGCGVRSISFHGDIMTIGTGMGALMFYDVRAQKYLESTINSSRTVCLKSSKGYLFPDEEALEQPLDRYAPAILTHCYDYTGTRIFAAGGPSSPELFGNYAGIWQ